MADIHVHREDIELDTPKLVEGLPGIGLVGKIATDHLIETHEYDLYASVHCETLPQLGIYAEGDRTVRSPVRIYANETGTELCLTSDIPVQLDDSMHFVDCVTGWINREDVLPIFLSGRPAQPTDEDDRPEPTVFGVASGQAATRLDTLDIQLPTESGAISGPTGALLHRCAERNMDAIGLVVDSNVQFPDPKAARMLIESAIDPIVGTETDTAALIDHANDIRAQREALAQSMQEAGTDASSQAQPLRMFQ